MSEPYPLADLIREHGAAKIAEAAGVDRTTPYSWRRGVPAIYAARVAEAVQMPPHVLRPDVFPAPQAAE